MLIAIILVSLSAHAQRDTVGIASGKAIVAEVQNPNISIYPVPVRENYFTVKSDKEISALKITNIIGQDIFRNSYNNPQYLIKVMLENPRRGMYLVSITFRDGTRMVRKIMIEGTV